MGKHNPAHSARGRKEIRIAPGVAHHLGMQGDLFAAHEAGPDQCIPGLQNAISMCSYCFRYFRFPSFYSSSFLLFASFTDLSCHGEDFDVHRKTSCLSRNFYVLIWEPVFQDKMHYESCFRRIKCHFLWDTFQKIRNCCTFQAICLS